MESLCFLASAPVSLSNRFQKTHQFSGISARTVRHRRFMVAPVPPKDQQRQQKQPTKDKIHVVQEEPLLPKSEAETTTSALIPTWLKVFPLFVSNIFQSLGWLDPRDNIPLLKDVNLFSVRPSNYLDLLNSYTDKFGQLYKIVLGPKAFVVVSDPLAAKHILASENALNYDKGLLAEILSPIMGEGLIPVRNLEKWKERRRVISPAFHEKWIHENIKLFNASAVNLVAKVERLNASHNLHDHLGSQQRQAIEMEEIYSQASLDITGKSIFNYEFNALQRDSEVIRAAYSLLKEAEHRSFFLLPYWNIPFSNKFVPRLIKFENDLQILNNCLNELIDFAIETREEQDIELLKARSYDQLLDRSLLRFVIDVRGADLDSKVLRDDLITLLIASHETTAAVLTWTTYLLAKHPTEMQKVQQELDQVFRGRPRGQKNVTLEDVPKLPVLRRAISEAMRLFPQPPILIRRALKDEQVPFVNDRQIQVANVRTGSDIFILPWNLHRCKKLWGNQADSYIPDRWLKPQQSDEVPQWKGFDPANMKPNSLYPSELDTNFGFMPFGGGQRKCVGDVFAFLQSTVFLSHVLSDYDIQVDETKSDGTYVTGATIHPANGLHIYLVPRK